MSFALQALLVQRLTVSAGLRLCHLPLRTLGGPRDNALWTFL